MNKVGKVLYKVFLIGFLLFPLLCALMASSRICLQMEYKKFALVIFSLFLGSLFLLYKLSVMLKISWDCENIKKAKIVSAMILFFVSMIIKYFMIIVLGDNIYQNSEYGCVLRLSTCAETANDLRHVSVFPHWSLVGFINRGIMKIFGENSVVFCQLINAVIISISVVVIFYISYEITKKISSALMGGLFFAIAPTENLYFLMLSNEFIAILAFVMITYIIVKNEFFMNKINSLKKNIAIIILLSFCFFLLKYSKPVGAVFFVAIAICFFIEKIIHKNGKIKWLLGMLTIVTVISSLMSNIYIERLSQYTTYPINENQAPHFLFIGLYSDYWTVGNIYESRMIEENFEYDIVNEEYMQIVKKDIKENIKKLPLKLKDNFVIQWQDYKNGLRMVLHELQTNTTNPLLFTVEGLSLWGGVITHCYYMLTLFFAIVSVLKNFILDKKYSMSYFFICLLCFGVALGLVFGESQERYKCVIVPILYLLAGDGIMGIFRTINACLEQLSHMCKKKLMHFNL